MHWPFRQPETARGVRRSVLHDRLAARGAGFGVVAGWERANWFATAGIEPRYVYTYGRQNWFAVRRRRAPGRAGGGRALRPVVLGQVPAPGTGRRGDAAAPVRQRRGRGRRADRLHADAQRAGRYRVRPDGDANRRRRLPGRDRGRGRHPRRGLDPPRHHGRAGHPHRRHLGLHRPRRHGAALARSPVAPDRRRSVERGIPVRERARDRAGLRAGAGHPHHLRRRAGLGAVRADRVRAGRLRGRGRRRRGPRPPPRRLSRDGLAPDGEGLSLLGPRHRPRRHAARGRTGLRGGLQEGRVHGTRGTGCASGTSRSPAAS